MRTRTLILLGAVTLMAACSSIENVVEGGPRWERIFFTPNAARVLTFNTDAAVFATNHGLFTAQDSDRFRKPATDLPGNPEIVGVATSSEFSDIYAVTELGYLLRSVDRGRNFSMIGQFPHTRITGLALTGAGRLFVSTSSGVLISNEDLAGMPARRVRSYLMPWETLVLGLPIWRRANLGGDTDLWKEWGVVLDGNIMRIAADPGDSLHIIAEVFDQGTVQSRDEGETWEPAVTALGERVKGSIAFGTDGAIMAGPFLSRDSGRSWMRTALKPDPSDLKQSRDADFPVHATAISRDGLWAIHYRAAAVYLSSDWGATWRRAGGLEDFRGKGRETSPAVLSVDPMGRVWVGTEGHGLYRFQTGSGVDKSRMREKNFVAR